MSSRTEKLTIRRGETFSLVMRWGTDPFVFKPITGISLAAGAPRLTVNGHGAPDGWPVAITRVKGTRQINAENIPPADDEYHPATVIDVNTLELNSVAPYDDNGNEWPAYTGGGFVQYRTPVDLASAVVRMKIKDKPKDKTGGVVLASTEAGDSPLDIIGVAINNTLKTITLSISATDTAALSWRKGYADIEAEISGVVTRLAEYEIEVDGEITTP